MDMGGEEEAGEGEGVGEGEGDVEDEAGCVGIASAEGVGIWRGEVEKRRRERKEGWEQSHWRVGMAADGWGDGGGRSERVRAIAGEDARTPRTVDRPRTALMAGQRRMQKRRQCSRSRCEQGSNAKALPLFRCWPAAKELRVW